MSIQLFVTDWAPNGTNDLLIVDGGDVVACIPEAVFGIDISKQQSQAGVWGDTLVDVEAVDGEHVYLVAEVSLATVRRNLAVHPGLSREDADKRLSKALIRRAA